jgi:hypothetical protein
MKDRNIYMQRVFEDYKGTEELVYWSDWLQNLPHDLEKIERALADQDSSNSDSSDNRPLGFTQAGMAIHRNVIPVQMSPAYEPDIFAVADEDIPDVDVQSQHEETTDLSQVPDLPNEPVLALQSPPEKIAYRPVLMQRLKEVQALGEEPLQKSGVFSDIELSIIFRVEKDSDWCIISPATSDNKPFVTVGHLLRRLERKAEQSNYYGWFREHIHDQLSKIGENYLKINLGLCALKNIPRLYFEFGNSELRNISYLFGKAISGETEDYHMVDKLCFWDPKIGNRPNMETHPQKFDYIVSNRNYTWIIDSYFTYRRDIDRLQSFYDRVLEQEERFEDVPEILAAVWSIFEHSSDFKDLEKHISNLEHKRLPNDEAIGHDDDYEEPEEVKVVSEEASEEDIAQISPLVSNISLEDVQFLPVPVNILGLGLYYPAGPMPVSPPKVSDDFKQKLLYEFIIIGLLVGSRYFFS